MEKTVQPSLLSVTDWRQGAGLFIFSHGAKVFCHHRRGEAALRGEGGIGSWRGEKKMEGIKGGKVTTDLFFELVFLCSLCVCVCVCLYVLLRVCMCVYVPVFVLDE